MMRPNKQMNPGVHRAGTTGGGKGRYFTTDLPRDPESVPPQATGPLRAGREDLGGEPGPSKYMGRASVGGPIRDEDDLVVDLTDPQEWVDPLDDDGFDLSSVTIDLRQKLRGDPPDSYYERYSSRVPGHQ
jgi:hypothetical protein